MPTLDEVNALSARGITQFRLGSFDRDVLTIVGSFDLCYYHDVEIIFSEVEYVGCATYLDEPTFRDAGPSRGGRRYEIRSDGELFEVVARDVTVVLGKVYYYDRGDQLQPGERIAAWVKR